MQSCLPNYVCDVCYREVPVGRECPSCSGTSGTVIAIVAVITTVAVCYAIVNLALAWMVHTR